MPEHAHTPAQPAAHRPDAAPAGAGASAVAPLLQVEGLHAGYRGLEVLHGVQLQVAPGAIVAAVGANGAGKTTTLRTLAGLVRPRSGTVRYLGEDVTGLPAHVLARRGLLLVPEQRALFGPLTVAENLRMGTWCRQGRDGLGLDDVLEIFPVLRERLGQTAETMSGGQQQMLAIGRALMGAPRLLLLDEPSTGLSPRLTWEVFAAVETVRDLGVGVLVVEQNAAQALALADHGYVLESGQVVLDGPSADLARDPRVQAAYLGG